MGTTCGTFRSARKERNVLEYRENGGANLLVCSRENVLSLAITTFRSPQRSRPALGRACFLPGSVRKGGHYGESAEKRAGIFGDLGAACLFDAECAAKG